MEIHLFSFVELSFSGGYHLFLIFKEFFVSHCDELAVCRQEKHPEPNKKHKENELKKTGNHEKLMAGFTRTPSRDRQRAGRLENSG